MLDFIVLIGGAFIGGVIVLVGSVMILGQKISGPRKELQQKIENLEMEIEKLKNEN